MLVFLPASVHAVSILVLMEVTLKAAQQSPTDPHEESFNPCFNGSDSKRGCWGFSGVD